MRRFLALVLAALALPALAAVTPLPGAASQRAPARTAFPNPIAVRVTDDAGKPVVNAQVFLYQGQRRVEPAGSWGSDPASLCWSNFLSTLECQAFTDADGIARFLPLAGIWASTSLAYVSASSRTLPAIGYGATTLEFIVDPIREPARLKIVQGDNQRLVAGATAAPMVVQLSEPDGSPLPQAEIWAFGGAFGGFTWPSTNSSPNFRGQVTTAENGMATLFPFVAGAGLGDFEGTVLYLDYEAGARVEVPLRYTVTNPEGGFTVDVGDLWWGGPSESGWGFSINQRGNTLFNVWFLYDEAQQPTWYVMPGGQWSHGAVGGNYYGDVYSPRGAPWYAYDASRFVPGPPLGSGNVDFGIPSTYTTLLVPARDGTVPAHFKKIVRQPIGEGPEPLPGLAGLWWGGPSQDGWGMAIHQEGSQLFLVWFTYGEDGKPTWFVMPGGSWVDGSTFEGSVYRNTGPAWSFVPFDTAAVKTTRVGDFRVRFDSTNAASMDATLQGRSVNLRLQRQLF